MLGVIHTGGALAEPIMAIVVIATLYGTGLLLTRYKLAPDQVEDDAGARLNTGIPAVQADR